MRRNYNNKTFRSIAAICGSFLIQMTFGSAYTADNFGDLIKTDFDLSMHIFMFAMFGLSASMSFGGFIEKLFKRSKTIFLGCIIMSYAVFISDFFSYKYLTIIYGLLCGLGAGLTYAITLGVPSQWSEHSNGFIVSIILSGFALGPIFYKAVTLVIQKINTKYKFMIFSGHYIIIQLIGIILIKKSKVPSNTEANRREPDISSTNDVESHKLFFEFDFYMIWLNLSLNSVGIILFFQLYPIILSLNPYLLCFLEPTIYFVSLTNAFGRILWGYYSDKISKQCGLILLNFGSMIMYLFLKEMFTYLKGNQDAMGCSTLYFSVMGIYYVWVSGNFTLIPALMIERFGEKHFPTNYGYIFTSYTVAGIVTCFFAKKIINNIDITLWVLLVMSFLSFSLSILLKFYPNRSITWTDFGKLFCCKA